MHPPFPLVAKRLRFPKRRSPSLMQVLFHPMVLASIVVHGLVLLTPVPSSPPPPEVAEETEAEKQNEEAVIPLTSLKPQAPPPQPTPQAVPSLAQAKPQIKPVVPPTPRPTVPTPRPVPTPIAQPKPIAPSPAPAPPSPAPSPVVQDYSGDFTAALPGVANPETANLGVPCNLFPQPELFFTPASLQTCLDTGADPEWLPGAVAFSWETRQRPEDVATKLQGQFTGWSFTPQGEYGGGALYQLKQGDTVRYANVIATKDGTGTLTVLWDTPPGTPGSQSAAATP